MNLAQLRVAVLNRMSLPSGDALATSTVLTELVNEAVHAIETEHDWPWLETSTTASTTAGTGTISMPTDWLRTREVFITDYPPMTFVGIADIDGSFDTSRGLPFVYAIYADTIELRPIPDAVYTIQHRYVMREPDLTSDTDTPLMPASFHGAIVEHATYLGLRRTREEGRAAVALDSYNNWLRRMTDNRRRSTQPLRVRVRPGSGY